MPTIKKILGAAKPRGDNLFELSDERLQVAEKALGSQPHNSAIRDELLSAFNQFQGLYSLWQQAPTPGKLLDECEKVLNRLKKGANILSVLNAREYQNAAGQKDKKAQKLNAGISGELLSYLILHGVDPDAPQKSKIIDVVSRIIELPRKKTGRPEEYARDGFLLDLAKIFKRETGKDATSSINNGRASGDFMELCRAMMIPSNSFMDADGLAIEKAWTRLKKRI